MLMLYYNHNKGLKVKHTIYLMKKLTKLNLVLMMRTHYNNLIEQNHIYKQQVLKGMER